MIIHLFTGSKGGIGKTRCSISHAMYYLLGGSKKPLLSARTKNSTSKYKISVFDANSNNIDFFTIMTGQDFQALLQKKQTENFIEDYIRHEIVSINHNERNLPVNGHAYIRKTPFEIFNGISDFWKSVYEVSKLTKEHDEGDALVVDTNFSVPNLVSENQNQNKAMSEIFPELKKIGVDHIVIWYIWCLNDFLSIRENQTYSTSTKIESLDRICETNAPGQKDSKINQYVIHVLNPYLFFEKTPSFRSFLNKLLSNKTFKSMIEGIDIEFKLPFELAVKMIVQIIEEIIKDNPDRSPSTWEKSMKQISEINNTGINIVVLNDQKANRPYIKEQLINISSNKLIDLETIHKENFGEDTLWKKLDEFHRWAKI